VGAGAGVGADGVDSDERSKMELLPLACGLACGGRGAAGAGVEEEAVPLELKRERISALALPPLGAEDVGAISLLEPKMSASRSCVEGPDEAPFGTGGAASSPMRSTKEPTSVLVEPTGFRSLAKWISFRLIPTS
jgi:hypothetical protein